MTHAYFSELHAKTDSQLLGLPCAVPDTAETAAARGDSSEQGQRALAAALDFQLRYREALTVYDQLLLQCPTDTALRRRRATRYINTLQPEKAISDLAQCRALGMPDSEVCYPFGIAYYLAGRYEDAMTEMARMQALSDEEMGIAAIYWHTLAAYRCGRTPRLLAAYHAGMSVGHHTAYERATAFAAGTVSEENFCALLTAESSDLEYAMLAYGYACHLAHRGQIADSRAALRAILLRDSFWIAYGYLAAWNDVFGG